MRRHWLRTFWVALTIAMPTQILAKSDDPTPADEFVMNAWADPAECNLTNAAAVTFAELASGDRVASGTCVVVEGIREGRALFAKFSHAKSKGSQSSERLRNKRVGLYADWDSFGDSSGEPRQYRVIGITGRCETQWPGAMMVMGYCHYTGGPILLVSDMEEMTGD